LIELDWLLTRNRLQTNQRSDKILSPHSGSPTAAFIIACDIFGRSVILISRQHSWRLFQQMRGAIIFRRIAEGDPVCLARLAEPLPDLFVGIDVGEKFLDLARVDSAAQSLDLTQISLVDVGEPVCEALAQRIAAAVPGIGADAIAIVDSPRRPRDLDSSLPAPRLIDPAPAARSIDAALREIYRVLRPAPDGKSPARGLSMFPTPRFEYFARCARAESCRAHLRAVARELFEPLLMRTGDRTGAGGGTFTRFMLAGFATYRALERLGASAYEAYPDLLFRLCAPPIGLPPKRRRREALSVRNKVIVKLASDLEIRVAREPETLDEADAAALALAAAASARRGNLWTVKHHCEGRFLLALDDNQSNLLEDHRFSSRPVKK
jgi:hypothetical protein